MMTIIERQRAHIVLAGATGGLGRRIAMALRNRGIAVTAIVRPGTAPDRLTSLQAIGVAVVALDLDDKAAVGAACAGATCVISALKGLEPTIVGSQGVLLEGAVAAGVPRFIPSDFSLDFTKTEPGGNRNSDLRRAFHRRLDAAPIRATSIFIGGFADMLTGQLPLIMPRLRRVLYWGDVDQRLDFTTMDDTAAFTAAAAIDPDAPRILRVAGDQVSTRELADAAGAAYGGRFRPLRSGGLKQLDLLIGVLRVVAPGRGQTFPPWQGLQYMRDMYSGRGALAPLDNTRYPDLRWTSVREVLASDVGESRTATEAFDPKTGTAPP